MVFINWQNEFVVVLYNHLVESAKLVILSHAEDEKPNFCGWSNRES